MNINTQYESTQNSSMSNNGKQSSDTPDTSAQTLNAAYTREYFDILSELGGDVSGRRTARAYMQSSTAICHHVVVESTFIPRLFDAHTHAAMTYTAETAHRILVKVMEHYLADPTYRRIFDFDERLEELICLPRGYDAVLPFARVDTFLNEDDLSCKFCEFNADGSSGMNENREITASITQSDTFKEFSRRHHTQSCELFESWVDTFLGIYDTYEHKVENPRIAIVDYLENAVVDEFYVFARLFATRGVECAIADVRELSFDGETLRDKTGGRIDAIWRRCVTNDVIEHWDESQELLSAIRYEKVALIGSFAGHIVHDKQIFKALFNPATKAFLTDEENAFIERTVPLTTFLDSAHIDLEQVRTHKDDWIIKPTDHYGADNVYAGCNVSQDEWENLIERFAEGRAGFPFIAQHYIRPFKTETLPPDTDIESKADDEVDTTRRLYNNLNGLYLYNGKFVGVFSRLGPLPTISKDMQGITAATIWVD